MPRENWVSFLNWNSGSLVWEGVAERFLDS